MKDSVCGVDMMALTYGTVVAVSTVSAKAR